MSDSLQVRSAVAADAVVVARIGREGVATQYIGLVDPAAVEAAVQQTYSVNAIAACIERCSGAELAEFLVAERDGMVEGFLHFDAFGPEPELHRLYVDGRARGHGAGHLLIEEAHARLPQRLPYMLLVVEGNDRAVAFYKRHGLHVAENVEGLEYYRDRMAVAFPPNTRPFRLLLMRRT
jgi:ribosomal protein S18 acetylase RimI-like enzyme